MSIMMKIYELHGLVVRLSKFSYSRKQYAISKNNNNKRQDTLYLSNLVAKHIVRELESENCMQIFVSY